MHGAYLSDDSERALVERLDDLGLVGKQVSVRWWSAAVEAATDTIKEEFVNVVLGYADVEFGAYYNETTGFLWFDEKFVVGGHDLVARIAAEEGRWVVLEIDVHDRRAETIYDKKVFE